jgi:hypothetical protein
MVAPHDEDACCVCLEAIHVMHFTTPIGDAEAHESCASDPALVAHCCACGTLGVREDITGWGLAGKDDLCPLCLADQSAEIEAERAEAEGAVRHAG